MEKLADISTFENLQSAANRSMASQMAVFNAYSDEERQERIEWCTTEIEQIRQELQEIRSRFLRAHNGYNMQRYLDGQYRIDQELKFELEGRIDALKNRTEQLRDKDPEGAFVVPCFEIETKLNEFKSQIGSAVDKPEQPRTLHNESSISGLSVFSNPSK